MPTTTQYQDLMFSVLDKIRDDIIEPNSSGSDIETRYIASEGRDDEAWLGYLRNSSGVVDIWLLTFTGLRGYDQENEQRGAVGTFTKPVSVVLDYYADYRQGVDYDQPNSQTNTEHEFLKKLFAVDLALEQKRGCLDPNISIRDWDFRIKLRRFEQATCHWANGVLNLELTDIIL